MFQFKEPYIRNQ